MMLRAVLLVIAFVLAGCNRKKALVTAPPPVVVSAPEPLPEAAPEPAPPPKRVRRAPPPRSIREQPTIPPLESMRSPEERSAIVQGLRASVARAEANIGVLRTRRLSSDDARELVRVDSFLRQARSAEQANDLVSARQYAQRAELLSQDLLNR